MVNLKKLEKELQQFQDPEKAKNLARFFKTGKGEYGEGDIFLGLNVPTQRKLAKKYTSLALGEIQKLLMSKIHEHRLVALLILVDKYQQSPVVEKGKIFRFYLKNTQSINNWDLVDLSAPKIVGHYLLEKSKLIIYKLAKSKSLWEKRIAVLATFEFIKNNQFEDSLKIAKMLLNDPHDLIHKAAGWMLREIGKRDQEAEEEFLKKHYQKMPRTMLRYAIERFEESKRKFYLKK